VILGGRSRNWGEVVFWLVKGFIVGKSKTSPALTAQYPGKQQQTGAGGHGEC